MSANKIKISYEEVFTLLDQPFHLHVKKYIAHYLYFCQDLRKTRSENWTTDLLCAEQMKNSKTDGQGIASMPVLAFLCCFQLFE